MGHHVCIRGFGTVVENDTKTDFRVLCTIFYCTEYLMRNPFTLGLNLALLLCVLVLLKRFFSVKKVYIFEIAVLKLKRVQNII